MIISNTPHKNNKVKSGGIMQDKKKKKIFLTKHRSKRYVFLLRYWSNYNLWRKVMKQNIILKIQGLSFDIQYNDRGISTMRISLQKCHKYRCFYMNEIDKCMKHGMTYN